MYDELSVFENVLYSALLFNRRGWTTRHQVIPMISAALYLLHLHTVALLVVGNSENKIISGGQKKRVSVAMELMKEAPLFLLDEPTSGLDSSTSMTLLNTLHELTDLGVTVLTTLHQPRVEIMELLDHIILLGVDGMMVYCGPAISLRDHFSAMGYTCPLHVNIADYVLDVVSDTVFSDNGTLSNSRGSTTLLFNKWWIDNKYSIEEQHATENALSNSNNHNNEHIEIKIEMRGILNMNKITIKAFFLNHTIEYLSRYIYNLYRIFSCCMEREFLLFHRNIKTFRFECILNFIFGLLITSIFGEFNLNYKSASNFFSSVTALNLTLSLLCVAPSLRVFNHDHLIRIREEETGLLQYIPYYISKVFMHMLTIFIRPLFFMLGFYSYATPRESLLQFISIGWLLNLSIFSAINIIALSVSEKKRTMVANGMIIIFWIFGGVNPTKAILIDQMGIFAIIANALSPFEWTNRMLIIAEFRHYPQIYFNYIIDRQIQHLQYSLSDWNLSVIFLLLYIFLCHMIALLWLLCSKDHFILFRNVSSYIIKHLI